MTHTVSPSAGVSGTTEKRLSTDTPLSAADIKNFDAFYREFLGKSLDDRLSFLKTMALFRRGDLREYLKTMVVFKGRFEQLIPQIKQRDLFLSFPNAIKNVSELILDFSESYGAEQGLSTIRMAKDQVIDYLDRTEMFRLDIDKEMESLPSMLPEDRRMLDEFLTEISRGGAPERTFRFVLLVLADHPFLSVLPSHERRSTTAIGKVRQFLEDQLGAERIEDEHIVEFFVIGGGYIRDEAGHLLLGGTNVVFDPQFETTDEPEVEQHRHRFHETKFQIAQQVLTTEFPGLSIRFQH